MHAAIALNLDSVGLRAAMRLLQAGEVDAAEWTYDNLHAATDVPSWFTDLVAHFARAGRLYGHGVFFSLFDGRWTPEQDGWLRSLRALTRRFPLRHVTEHFGFLSGADFHRGAPLSPPMDARALRLGTDRLRRIADAAGCPAGVENLALAFSREDVLRQGAFLAELTAATGGFLILDLHNLYCQAHNFGVPAADLLAAYPLERVRELHLAGGSWRESAAEPGRRVRRDTHDGAVPEEVWALLEEALARCPHLELALLEQVPRALATAAGAEAYRADFRRMRRRIQSSGVLPVSPAPAPPERPPLPEVPLADEALYAEQRALVEVLAQAPTPHAALERLRAGGLEAAGWDIRRWDVSMVETAMDLVRTWG